MMDPPPPLAISGTAYFEIKTMLLRSTSRTRSQKSSEISVTVPGPPMATLFIKMSSFPYRVTAVLTSSLHTDSSATSPMKIEAFPPSS